MASLNRVFTGYGYRIIQRGTAVALAGVLAVGMAPSFAFADAPEGATSAQAAQAASASTLETASALEVGITYSVPFSMVKEDGTASMSGNMMNSSATITPAADGVYTITMVVKAGSAYTFNSLTIGGVNASLESQDDTQYVFTATGVSADLSQKVEIGFNYTVPAMNMTHSNSAYAVFDLASATVVSSGSSDSGSSDSGSTTGGSTSDGTGATDGGSSSSGADGAGDGGAGSDAGSQSGSDASGSTSDTTSDAGSASDGSASESGSGYQVGHTYEVPISFMQTGTDNQSMAAQYFGSTAYVRPLADGTFEVSFSTNRSDYIGGISYNGTALAQDGDTFTVVIPASESDVVVPLGMSIVPMQQLGAGDVTVDLHVGLSDPTDLGTNADGAVPSSESSVDGTAGGTGSTASGTGATGATGTAASTSKAASALPSTGDSNGGVAAGAVALGAAAVAAGAGAMMRRNRLSQGRER